MVDRKGIPLAVIHSAANVHDSKVLEEMVDAISPIRKSCGRPRKRPKKLHADKAYDFPRCREALRKRDITPRIARRGIESRERVGRHRWVMERTLSWVNRFRRLKVRYERRDDVHQAFLDLGCADLLALCSAVMLGASNPLQRQPDGGAGDIVRYGIGMRQRTISEMPFFLQRTRQRSIS